MMVSGSDNECQEAAEAALADYYRRPAVRRCITEYCGDAWSLAGYGGRRRLTEPDGGPVPGVGAGLEDLSTLLDDGADVCRSLADKGGALLHLDVDYVNPSSPVDPCQRPESVFAVLEPVYHAVQAVFVHYGIRPLSLMTGRGYHFVARAPLDRPLHRALVEIGTLDGSLRRRYARRPNPAEATLAGRAHEGAGRLAELLAHVVARRLAGRTAVPVALADVPPTGGGPFVCLDLTAYADPVFERYVRSAFSAHQKAWMSRIAPERPFTLCIPRGGESLSSLLRARENPERAAEMASAADARIPEAPDRSVGWADEYRHSPLARFHRDFQEGPRMEPSEWPFTYDALDLRALPACARLPLEAPNPALLTPVHLRTLALGLWGLGWHPRSIAALVESRYEKEHGWGSYWSRYDAASRAGFYVRLFCGLMADGLEGSRDFTCESQDLRGVCPRIDCGFDLARLPRSKGAS